MRFCFRVYDIQAAALGQKMERLATYLDATLIYALHLKSYDSSCILYAQGGGDARLRCAHDGAPGDVPGRAAAVPAVLRRLRIRGAGGAAPRRHLPVSIRLLKYCSCKLTAPQPALMGPDQLAAAVSIGAVSCQRQTTAVHAPVHAVHIPPLTGCVCIMQEQRVAAAGDASGCLWPAGGRLAAVL